MNDHPAPYRVLSPARVPGGKTVTVFPDVHGDLQARAAAAGTPLSVFVQHVNVSDVVLRVFTPDREKGDSDSGALAALSWLFGRQEIGDLTDVTMGGDTTPAQMCGGEWLLRQGDPQVQPQDVPDLAHLLGLQAAGPAHVARIARPNLAVALPGLPDLQRAAPHPDAVRQLGEATGTTGLILYVPGGAADLGRADVSFRAFGPLRGFTEDAASSNMLACLVGVLGARGLLPEGNLLTAHQLRPGQPARLQAQYVATPDGAEGVWVGGTARREDAGADT
ncbi:PhzF family phenazine biosynthesis protein [Deinococcus aquiradiocola]|uniref:Phenazine biosynthesis PhzC/PhzF protein n=1 Tax=Deinococcus aquiradiocola TaxID=393059 RepID=A0A917UQ15_9DEIO|nr:PhzF family phenazine biosynthesis protein [Deinococcus aquiradiocola]GGJ74168.1 hypothetical protein GCM10008939_18080 [Deinococcus aquiradiocola]